MKRVGSIRLKSVELTVTCAAVVLAALGAGSAGAQTKPVKIGVVTFMSGPAAGPFGVPAKNSAEVTAAELNAGKVPAPYNTKGFGGAPIELVYIDEAGSTSKQVSEYRNLLNQGVDYVVGYTSSGNCLAVAPVAEEMKKVTLLFDCGTPRVFEDASYKYVFRPVATATMDNVGAALYVADKKPGLKTYGVWIGSPVWLYSPAPPIWNFVENNRFDGQRVVLFNTYNSHFGDDHVAVLRDKVMARGARSFEHRHVLRGRMTRQLTPDEMLRAIDDEWFAAQSGR